MNKYVILASVLSMVSAQAADTTKICVYNPDALMAQSKELHDVLTVVDKSYQAKFDVLKKEDEALRDADSKLRAKAAVMNEAAREAEEEGLMRKGRDLKKRADALEEDYKLERQKVGTRYFKKLEAGIDSFRQTQQFAIVMPKTPGVSVAPDADKTAALAEYLNKGYEDSKKSTRAA